MASTVGAGGSASPARSAAAGRIDADTSTGHGWVLFAGTMIALIGVLNFIYGIAAIDDSRIYARDATYVISDLNTWGWALVVVGIVQIAAAVGIWMQAPGARWIGIAAAACNALVQMLIIPAFPLWSITIFAIDVLIIYGLLAHGRRVAPA